MTGRKERTQAKGESRCFLNPTRECWYKKGDGVWEMTKWDARCDVFLLMEVGTTLGVTSTAALLIRLPRAS